MSNSKQVAFFAVTLDPSIAEEKALDFARQHRDALIEWESKCRRDAEASGAIFAGSADAPELPDSVAAFPDVRQSVSGPIPDWYAIGRFVKGWVEMVRGTLPDGKPYTAFLNEEGRITGMPFNPIGSALTGRMLCGPVWIFTEDANDLFWAQEEQE